MIALMILVKSIDPKDYAVVSHSLLRQAFNIRAIRIKALIHSSESIGTFEYNNLLTRAANFSLTTARNRKKAPYRSIE